MKIKDFAAQHGLEQQAVRKYLKRHPELKIQRQGREIELSDEVVEQLEKQYPPPKPVQVIQGVPHEEHERVLRQVQELQAKLIESQEKQLELTQQLAQEQQKTLLLEQKDQEIERLKGRTLWERILNK